MRLLLTFFLVLGVIHPQSMVIIAKKKAAGGGTITEVQAPSGNAFAGTTKAFPTNVTSGNLLIAAAVDNTAGATIGGSGTGCASTTWTLQVSQTANTPKAWLWTGNASGSGACTVTISGIGSTPGVNVLELSSSGAGPSIDSTGAADSGGSAANNLTVTASSATTASGGYCYVAWVLNDVSETTTATGWTERFNNNYQGGLTQTSVSSGTTASAALVYVRSSNTAGVLACLKP